MGLELEREPGRRNTAPAAADTDSFYPKPRANTDWFWALLRRVALLVGVALLAFVGWRMWLGDAWTRPLRRAGDRVLGAFGDADAQRRGTGSNEGIDCATGTPGEFLIYTGDDGSEHVVESAAQVPSRFHHKVRCIHLGGGKKGSDDGLSVH
jgi:hypothetical protein